MKCRFMIIYMNCLENYFLQFGKFDVIYFFRKNKKRLLADFCPILHELYPLFY